MPPQINPQVIAKINDLSQQATPLLGQIAVLLRENNLHEFELSVDGRESFFWSGGLENKQSPNEEELTNELQDILDQSFPRNILMFMGMIYNPNRQVARKIAEIVSMHRAKDRREVASQIMALLAAFQQGS